MFPSWRINSLVRILGLPPTMWQHFLRRNAAAATQGGERALALRPATLHGEGLAIIVPGQGSATTQLGLLLSVSVSPWNSWALGGVGGIITGTRALRLVGGTRENQLALEHETRHASSAQLTELPNWGTERLLRHRQSLDLQLQFVCCKQFDCHLQRQCEVNGEVNNRAKRQRERTGEHVPISV